MVAGRAFRRGHGCRNEQTQRKIEGRGMFSNMNFFLRIVAPCLAFSLLPLPAWAERIWDNELKRFLTEQEMTHAEVFLTEEQAVKLMLPKSERIRKEVLQLSQGQKTLVESRIGWKFPETS